MPVLHDIQARLLHGAAVDEGSPIGAGRQSWLQVCDLQERLKELDMQDARWSGLAGACAQQAGDDGAKTGSAARAQAPEAPKLADASVRDAEAPPRRQQPQLVGPHMVMLTPLYSAGNRLAGKLCGA